MVVAGSQCIRAMLLMLGFRVRYSGWDNVEEGRKEHAVRRRAATADPNRHDIRCRCRQELC